MVINRIKETISMLKGLEQDTLEGLRYTLIFFIVIDMILFYWFMKWKRFSIAMLMVCLIILAIILLLERKFPQEDIEEKPKDNKINPVFDNKPKQESVGDVLNIDLGLPDPEEYNKRLEKAIGT